MIKARKNYRITNSGRFIYDVGCEYKSPYVRNTATRQIIDDHPFEVDREVSSTSLLHRMNNDSLFLADCENGHQLPINSRVNMKDLYNALQDKNLIPCHSVYANNIERISQLLNCWWMMEHNDLEHSCEHAYGKKNKKDKFKCDETISVWFGIIWVDEFWVYKWFFRFREVFGGRVNQVDEEMPKRPIWPNSKSSKNWRFDIGYKNSSHLIENWQTHQIILTCQL